MAEVLSLTMMKEFCSFNTVERAQLLLLEAELLVVVEEVDEADPAVDSGADHTPQVSPLKVGPHNLVQLPVTQHLKSRAFNTELLRGPKTSKWQAV